VSSELTPLVNALRGAVPPQPESTRLATVTGYNSTGVLVRFDGESIASSRRYKATHPVFVNMRVLMTRAGSTWVVNGDVDGSPDWIAPTLLNSWGNYGGIWETAGYRRVAGVVYIRGLVTGGAVSSVIFNLPAGYRPSSDAHVPAMGQGSSFSPINIFANGNVTQNAGATGYISLRTIPFPADA
jgi:hypothetical protein